MSCHSTYASEPLPTDDAAAADVAYLVLNVGLDGICKLIERNKNTTRPEDIRALKRLRVLKNIFELAPQSQDDKGGGVV
jgi:hypothetical protein